MTNDCACRRCVKEIDSGPAKSALDLFMSINFVCPTCHDRNCPSAEDHREQCHKAYLYAPEQLAKAS